MLFRRGLCAVAQGKVAPLEDRGFKLSETIQEDYGWGFWAREGKDSFWVAVSCIGSGPEEYNGEWGISISYDPGLNPSNVCSTLLIAIPLIACEVKLSSLLSPSLR